MDCILAFLSAMRGGDAEQKRELPEAPGAVQLNP